MKKIIIVTFIIGVGLLLSGCGVTEKIAEKSIESATNNEVDVDIDNNGLTVNTNEGTLQVGKKVSLPDNWPSDIYIEDGAIISATTSNEQNGFSVTIESTNSLNIIKEKYKTELTNNGWAIDSSFDITGVSSITANKNNRSVTISITENSKDNTTIVGISTFDK